MAERKLGAAKPSFTAIARKLLAEEGPQGLLKGVAPRMASTALWGTCMVSLSLPAPSRDPACLVGILLQAAPVMPVQMGTSVIHVAPFKGGRSCLWFGLLCGRCQSRLP